MRNDPSQYPPPPKKTPLSALPCPICRQSIVVGTLAAGTTISCPQCRRMLQVPQPGGDFAAVPQTDGFVGSAQPYGFAGAATMTPAQMEYHSFVSRKLAAGLCGIFFGEFGVHKFVLGFSQAGVVMLVVTVLCGITFPCFVIPILAVFAMKIIGFIEGIMYLSKSDADFYQAYAIDRRDWF
jgi:TM2 domain-containing membrane protein YozV